jgi:hypothetical protein
MSEGGPDVLVTRPPQQEVTHVGAASEVTTPWQIWVRSCMVWGAIVGSVTLIVLTLTFAVGFWASKGRMFVGYELTTSQRVELALDVVGDLLYWTWAFPPVAWLVGVIYQARLLLRNRYEMEQRNRNWPPPYDAVDPTKVGLLDRDALERMGEQLERAWAGLERDRVLLDEEWAEFEEQRASWAGEAAQASLTSGLLWAAAFGMLDRYYRGEATTREACESEGGISQRHWRKANDVFGALGWGEGVALEPPAADLSRAWEAWRYSVKVDEPDVVWVRNGNARGWTRVQG